MSISTAVSRFPAGDQVVVVVNAFVAGSPTDTLHGAWAMLDESGRVVAHDTHVLTTAACDPGSSRVATFAASVPAGEYRIDLTVSDARSRRGLTHLTTHIAPGNGRLALGDLVLLCGGVPAAFGANYAGIEPNLEGRVSERAVLSMYYELDRLATGPDGQSHFSYTYSIRPNGSGAKSASVVYEATREEFHVGSHRRQFVSVADARLPPGAYVLTLEVKDVIDGDTVHGTLRFWTGIGRSRLRPGAQDPRACLDSLSATRRLADERTRTHLGRGVRDLSPLSHRALVP
jgi:hypothetical protein